MDVIKAIIGTIVVLGLTFVLVSWAHGKYKPEVITLTASNSYTFYGEVTTESVAKAELAIFELSAKLKSTDTIYLVLDTPGGSIPAGLMFVDAVHGLPQKVKTITIVAMSMGFQIVQSLDERLILPNGELMSHRAAGSVGGQAPGNLIVRLEHLMNMVNRLDEIAAKRMGMNLKSYQNLIRDEYYVTGEDAVKAGAADRVVLIKCGSDLLGTEKVMVSMTVGPLVVGEQEVEVSKCPLVPR